ncbi:hypothetical protein DIPPA_23932 [Diplonema papillatum]|nr:hypothetical protein DIPPA_23932 [Diplonema papillatum]
MESLSWTSLTTAKEEPMVLSIGGCTGEFEEFSTHRFDPSLTATSAFAGAWSSVEHYGLSEADVVSLASNEFFFQRDECTGDDTAFFNVLTESVADVAMCKAFCSQAAIHGCYKVLWDSLLSRCFLVSETYITQTQPVNDPFASKTPFTKLDCWATSRLVRSVLKTWKDMPGDNAAECALRGYDVFALAECGQTPNGYLNGVCRASPGTVRCKQDPAATPSSGCGKNLLVASSASWRPSDNVCANTSHWLQFNLKAQMRLLSINFTSESSSQHYDLYACRVDTFVSYGNVQKCTFFASCASNDTRMVMCKLNMTTQYIRVYVRGVEGSYPDLEDVTWVAEAMSVDTPDVEDFQATYPWTRSLAVAVFLPMLLFFVIRALLRVAGRSKEGGLAAAGKGGVFTTLKGDGRGALWLRDDLTLDEARKAAARAKTSLIVSVRGMGVLKGEGKQAEAAMRALLGTAAAQEEEQPGQPGQIWDVAGFPRTISPVQVAAFLHAAGWTGVEVIRVIPKRSKRLAVVRGPEPPAWIFQVETTGELVTVSTVREKDEAQPRWVQTKGTEETRTDPAEDGTERQGMTYAKAAFIGLYGRKQGLKAWSDGRPQTTQAAPAETGQQSGPPGNPGADIPQTSDAPPPNAGKGGKKGKKGGKAGKHQPQPAEQDAQRPDEVRAKLEREVSELRAQNADMCRKMEELGTLVQALRAQLQARTGDPQKTTSPSPKRQSLAEPDKVKKRPRSLTKSKSRSPEPPKQPPSKATRTLKQMGFGSTAPALDAERLRQMVVDEMGARPADYRPYMVMEPGPDSRGLTVAEELAKWQAYLAAMRRNATYGDELTLRAASRVLRCDIWVLNATSREALRGCRQPSPTATIVLTYRPEHYDTVILPLPSQRLLEATTGDTVPLARLALINAGPVAGTDAPTHHLPTGVPAAARTRQRNTRPRAPEPRLPSIAEAKQDRSWSPHDDDIVIVTINVTSLDTEKLLVVALLKADIVVLQETRVTKAEKAYMGSFLAAYGWNVHWGDDVTMVEGGDGRSQRRPGGVAVLSN